MSAAWYSAADLAKLSLPGMPGTDRAIQIRAKREEWPSKAKPGRGGGKLYPTSALPREAQDALARRQLQTIDPAPKTEVEVQPASALKDWQRRTMDARAALLTQLDRLTEVMPKSRAIEALVKAANREELAPDLQALVPAANARGKALSRSRIYEWLRLREAHGVVGLAPAPARKETFPTWASDFMDLYARPQKPSIVQCLEQMGADAPSYDQARRFLKKLDTVTRNKGRMGPRALKSLRAYVKRDTSELWPTAVYSADGHTFDAEVAHPIHGKPFRPEITTVIDAFTKRVVGWSAAIAEATWGTLDAIRHAFENGGVCDIWYVDRGMGFNNATFDAELTGVLARFGVTKQNALPYGSQARGLVERVHRSIWVRGAKTLPTYMGAAMDDEARQKAFKITRREVRETGQSRLLMAWNEFLSWAGEQVADYNTRPHSALPKIRCHITGKFRHMSPDEAWMAAVDDGFEPDVVSDEHADLFRPYERRKVNRATVSLFSNSYFHHDLEGYHGEDVLVGYDIHDAGKVWVRDLESRLICVAIFEGNAKSYFPVTVAEQARERRAKGRMMRLVDKAREVEAEVNPDVLLEAVNNPLSEEEKIAGDQAYERLTANDDSAEDAAGRPALTLVDERPMFNSEFEWAQWLSLHPEKAEPEDIEHLAGMLKQPSFKSILTINGVDLETLRDLASADAVNQTRSEF